jgi:hypothetical protein
MKRKKEKWVSAEELKAQLAADPDYQALRRKLDGEHALRVEEYARAEKPVLAALWRVGVEIGSLQDLMERDFVLQPDAVEALLALLATVRERGVLDTVIRSLMGASEPFDAEPLIRLFEELDAEENAGLRWTITFTLVHSPVANDEVKDWARRVITNSAYGMAREPLIRVAHKLGPREKVIPALLSVLPEIPGHVAFALRKIGRRSELTALRNEAQKKHEHKWIDKEIARAIEMIERRAEKEKL